MAGPGSMAGEQATAHLPDALRDPYANRLADILAWAERHDQSWLTRFFRSRLAEGSRHDPRAEVVAAMLEARSGVSAEGLVLADTERSILFANSPARQLFALGRWLAVDEGRLRAIVPEWDHQLLAAMRAAAGDLRTMSAASRPATCLRLTSGDDGDALLIRLGTCPMPDTIANASPFVTMVLLRDDALIDLDGGNLIDCYGLSPAEARLAVAFANGHSLTDHARANRVSINTVRTQFAQIKVKLAAADQAAVVRKVLRVAGLR